MAVLACQFAQGEGGDESAVTTAASSAVAVGPYAATSTPRMPHPSQRSPKTTAWSSGFDAPSNRAVDSITAPLGRSVCPHVSQRNSPPAVTLKSARYPRARSAVISSATVGACMTPTVRRLTRAPSRPWRARAARSADRRLHSAFARSVAVTSALIKRSVGPTEPVGTPPHWQGGGTRLVVSTAFNCVGRQRLCSPLRPLSPCIRPE
jgi:hypothetical protein